MTKLQPLQGDANGDLHPGDREQELPSDYDDATEEEGAVLGIVVGCHVRQATLVSALHFGFYIHLTAIKAILHTESNFLS